MFLQRNLGGLATSADIVGQADPKLAFQKDDDGRLPIHWAASSNQFEIVSLLVQQKGFDPDVQVGQFFVYLTYGYLTITTG